MAAQAPKIAASPARVWRTLPQSYEQKQEAWLNARGVRVAMKVGQDKKYGYLPAPFGLHTAAELKNYAFRYSLAGSQTEGLANNARSLLNLVIKANPGRKNRPSPQTATRLLWSNTATGSGETPRARSWSRGGKRSWTVFENSAIVTV